MADNINDEISVALEPAEPELQLQIPEELPLLPLRDIVIYPFMIVPCSFRGKNLFGPWMRPSASTA